MDNFGIVIGILVFAAGMGLLGWVFFEAYQFPADVAHALDTGQAIRFFGHSSPSPLVERPTNPDRDEDELMSPLVRFLSLAGLKLVTILVLGGIASLIAHKGAVLIGAFRGKREG